MTFNTTCFFIVIHQSRSVLHSNILFKQILNNSWSLSDISFHLYIPSFHKSKQKINKLTLENLMCPKL